MHLPVYCRFLSKHLETSAHLILENNAGPMNATDWHHGHPKDIVMIPCNVWNLPHRRSWISMQWPSVLRCWLVYMEANRRYLTFTYFLGMRHVYIFNIVQLSIHKYHLSLSCFSDR